MGRFRPKVNIPTKRQTVMRDNYFSNICFVLKHTIVTKSSLFVDIIACIAMQVAIRRKSFYIRKHF